MVGEDELLAKVGQLDVERRLKNAKWLGFGLGACVVPTLISGALVPQAPLLLRGVPFVTFFLLVGAGAAAHQRRLGLAVLGIVTAGLFSMFSGVATHPQLWSSPYGLGLLVLAASMIASPRGVLLTAVASLVVLGGMGWVAWSEPQEGAPVAFTLVTAGVMLVMAAVITLVQVRSTRLSLRELLEHERKRFAAEHQVDTLQLRLTDSQKLEALGRLAGGIAHDFNNYLQVVGASNHLAHSELPEEHPTRSTLRPALDAVQHAETLTKQILAFSRRQVLPGGTSDVGQALSGMTRLMQALVGSSITLDVEIEPGRHLVALGAGQLEQVVMNLVVNARDAMQGSGEIHVRVFIEGDAGTGDVVLSVSDTGPGLDDELKRQVFDPFFTTKPDGKGTGLGLHTCQRIVEEAGGELTIDSQLGHGATFKARLPRVDRSAA